MPSIKTALAISMLILSLLACNALTSPAQPTPTAVVIVEPTGLQQSTDGLPVTEADVPRIPLEAAFTAQTAGAALIVDVRSAQAYAQSHIPGALNIPLEEFETNLANLDLPKDQWIITYCT